MDYLQEEESMYLEKKKSLSDLKGIGRTICAFANTSGGTLVVGVKNSKVYGVDDADEAQRKIFEIIRNKIKPQPHVTISIEKVKGKKVLVVKVSPMPEGEVCTYDGRIFIRVGSVNKLVEGRELVSVLHRKGILSFEDSLSPYGIEMISEEKVERYFELRGGTYNGDLKATLSNLGMIKGDRVTNLALLLFSKKPEQTLPQSGVKIAVFEGEEPVDIVRHKVIFDTVFQLIDRSFEYVKDNITRIEIRGRRRYEIPQYPLEVIREVIVNAIGHRDYFNQNLVQIQIFSNRIEVVNPGRPLIPLSELGKLASHRNPRLYIHLSFAGYSEGYGTGIARMRKILLSKGYSEPKFEVIGDFFKVTIFNKGILGIREKILELLSEKPMSAQKISKKIGISVTATLKHLKKLEEEGKVVRKGRGRGSKFHVIKT